MTKPADQPKSLFLLNPNAALPIVIEQTAKLG